MLLLPRERDGEYSVANVAGGGGAVVVVVARFLLPSPANILMLLSTGVVEACCGACVLRSCRCFDTARVFSFHDYDVSVGRCCDATVVLSAVQPHVPPP